MPCYKPLHGYKANNGGFTGNKANSTTGIKMKVPCGQCIGCRLERSRQWAIRMVHELKDHSEACFITLTYNNENLPDDRSIHVEHFQKFMKDLRYHFSTVDQDGKRHYRKIRYFHCGEYGEECLNCGANKYNCNCGTWSPTIGRPHYHAILYGVDFYDREHYKTSPAGSRIYKSKELASIWDKGYVSVGDVTFESCAYVARYVVKKITGDKADGHYITDIKTDPETGEIIGGTRRKPEYVTMSRRPGIGANTAEKYRSDMYPHDRVVTIRKKKSVVGKPPRYYDKLLEKSDPEMYEEIKSHRRKEAAKHASEQTEERLISKQICKYQQISSLKRDLV